MKITTKLFLKQLIIKDLFGKDSQRGVSLTYAWLANQFGHFALGFIPSIFFSVLLEKNYTPFNVSMFVASFWFIFEIFNLYLPIILEKKNRLFKPEWSHLINDTVTDILYFTLGALASCILISEPGTYTCWTTTILAILLFFPFKYWYTIRMYQQYAYFPFQYRLSQWNGDFVDNDEKEIVTKYIKETPKSNGNHLLIFGKVTEGKSNLGVAIANELAQKKQTCTYITATKLYSLFYSSDVNKDLLWNWKNCKYLIIDDINPDKLKHISPSDFLQYVDKFTDGNVENRNCLKDKNIIWVLGTCLKSEKEKWSDMLIKLGVHQNKINKINLSH